MANILVIDGDAILLDLIANTLRLDGHDVTALCSPLAAPGAQAVGNSPIDLLLTDIATEPISGFGLVRRLSKAGFTGPVLFMSGDQALAGAVAESLGKHAIVEKPFTAPQLRAAVRGACGRGKPKPPSAPER